MINNYIAISFINIFILIILFYMFYRNDVLKYNMKVYFSLAAVSIIIINIAEMGTENFWGYYLNNYIINIICNCVGFMLSPIIPFLITKAMSDRLKKTYMFFVIPAFVNIIFVLLSPNFGFIFSVGIDSSYTRGPLFFVYIIACVTGYLTLLIETFVAIKKYQTQNRITLLLLFLFIICGSSLQVLVPQIHTTWFSITLALITYYAYYCELEQKIDSLSGLFNRLSYENNLRRLDMSKKNTIIIFDIDNFKKINDEYGHQKGDKSIVSVADNIKKAFSKAGTCFRIGGDEFCVICKNVSFENINIAITKFDEYCENTKKIDSRMPNVSYGIASSSKNLLNVDELVENADKNMYDNKQRNKKIQIKKNECIILNIN